MTTIDISFDNIGDSVVTSVPVKISKPTLQTRTIIDDIETGRAARKYREIRRIRLCEVATRVKGPAGRLLGAANLAHFEAGRRHWTADILNAYVRVVDEVAETL
jgi:hypothetical protein